MDIQTTPELARDENGGSFFISEHDFRVLGPDGTRENDSVGNAFMCLEESETIPSVIGPAETVKGKIVLDSKYSEGLIVLNLLQVEDGWEWVF